MNPLRYACTQRPANLPHTPAGRRRGCQLPIGLTHRGKPPAPPGDSPRFDLYDGPREFLISAKRKEVHDERVPEPEPYEMGLQISRGVYSEATEEAGIRSVTATAWGDFSRIGLTQGVHDRGGTHDGRPCAHVLEHCAQIRGLERGWITEGEERDPDCAQVRRPPEKFHRRALLGQGVLRFHGRAGREHRSSVHPQPGSGRRALRPDETRHGMSRPGRLMVTWAPLRRSPFQATGYAGGI